MRRLAVLLLLTACHMEDSPRNDAKPKPSSAAADALWALAPATADLGLVVTPRGVGMIEHAWLDVRTALHAAPDLAPIAAEIDGRLAAYGKPDLRLADVGLTADKGFAVFYTRNPESLVAIFPVADRDKFLKAAPGKPAGDHDELAGSAVCKTIGAVYACAPTLDQLAHLGSGKLAALAKAGPRGDLEVAGALGDAHFAIAGQLARGAITLRASITGMPPEVLDKVATPITPRPLDGAAGFGVANLSKFMSALPPETPIVDGVTVGDLMHAFDGPTTLLAFPGTDALDIQIPLTDPKPVATVLQHCDIVGQVMGASAEAKDGGCSVSGTTLRFGGDVWLDGSTLHVGKRGLAEGRGVQPSEIGKELANGTWGFAVWGRGAIFESTKTPSTRDLEPGEAMTLRVLELIDELGFAAKRDGNALQLVVTLRTVWANPDDVVAKVVAITPQQLVAGEAAAAARAIAAQAPGSPFAADLAAGTNGLLMPTTIAGVAFYVASAAAGNFFSARSAPEELPLPGPQPESPPAP